jgi:hypothetical protein
MIKKGMNKLEQARLRKAIEGRVPEAGIRQVFRRIHPATLTNWIEYFSDAETNVAATKAHAKQREADSEIEVADAEAEAAEVAGNKAEVKKAKAKKKKAKVANNSLI